MNIYSVLIAGAAGAIAALIAGAIFGFNQQQDKERSGRTIGYIIVAGILFVTLNSTARTLILPELEAYETRKEVESMLLSLSAYQSIKVNEPATYEKLVDTLSEGLRQGESEQELVASARQSLMSILEKRIPRASDEAVLAYLKINLINLDQLRKKGPEHCFAYLYPRHAGKVSLSTLVTGESLIAEMAALSRVIESYDAQRPIPTEVHVMPVFEPVLLSLYEQFGDDLFALENPDASGLEKGRICEMTSTMLRKIQEMEPEHAAQVMKWSFSVN